MESQSRPRPRRANESGPSGRRVAGNLEHLREQRRLNQEELAGFLSRLGRPMTRQMVSKSESGDRRIDVDDLVAFAAALDTTPNRLLLTGTADGSRDVELTPELRIPELAAWRWADGEEPLPQTACGEDAGRERLLRYYREAMPQHDIGTRERDRRAEARLAADPELARMTGAVVNAARHRGLDLSALLDIIGYVHVQERFGLPYGRGE